MSTDLDVAIVGAGPYGLSIAAYLRAARIDHRVFGPVMDSWEHHMPPGMCLKSYGESSNLFDPAAELTLERFCRDRGIEYHHRLVPVKLDTFVAYGKAFRERVAPEIELTQLTELEPTKHGHKLRFANGKTVTAKRVVLAVGVVPYRYVPDGIAHLPQELWTHSCDHGSLADLAGKKVTVIGRGSSALDIADLLSRLGSAVIMVCRAPAVKFQNDPAALHAQRSALHRAARNFISPPARGLGDGWILSVCAKSPQWIRRLPDRARRKILNYYLGPSGGYFVRRHIEQHVDVRPGRTVERIEEKGGRIQVTVRDRGGRCETIESDRLLAATGYRVDMRKLGFMNETLLRRLRMAEYTPVLSQDYESSIPGIHFVGLSSARGFGPIMRFVEGAIHPAERLAWVLGRPTRH